MKEPFRQALSVQSITTEEIRAEAVVPDGSAWYAGHFPGQPILPGIAILGLVAEAIRGRVRAEGRTVTITGVSRVRFRLPVAPGDRMEIRATRGKRKETWAYPFTVTLGGEPLCSGIFTGSEREKPPEQNP